MLSLLDLDDKKYSRPGRNLLISDALRKAAILKSDKSKGVFIISNNDYINSLGIFSDKNKLK